jgi:hypothetical protein
MQHDVAKALSRRLPPSDRLVSEMITAAVHAALSTAVDQWATEGAHRELQEYWDTMVENVLQLWNQFNRQYVLR